MGAEAWAEHCSSLPRPSLAGPSGGGQQGSIAGRRSREGLPAGRRGLHDLRCSCKGRSVYIWTAFASCGWLLPGSFLQATIDGLRAEVAGLLRDVAGRDETISEKERRILELKLRAQELEKVWGRCC